MKNKLFNCIIILILAFYGCEIGKPRAEGADNELVVVTSFEDRESIQSVITALFNDTLYSPQPEPFYRVVWVDPENFNNIKFHVNVIVAGIGNNTKNVGTRLIKNLLTDEQYTSTIEGDNQLIYAKNIFSRDQNYLIINGPNLEKLIEQVKDKGAWLKKQYDELLFKRQSIHLFEGSTRQKDLEKSLLEKYGWTLKIPWGYTIIRDNEEERFFWMGRDIPYRWLAVQWKDGLVFSDSVSVHNYAMSLPPKYFGHIQYSDYLFKIEPVSFNDWGAWKISGLWESIEEAQGGPFISYLFYDESSNRSYFIHSMIFHPGQDKFLLLKQVDIVAHSFKVDTKY